MLKRLKDVSTGAFVALVTAVPAFAQLQGATPNNLGRFSNLSSTIQAIFGFVITIAGIFFVILFLVGGIQYLTAAGDADGTKKAKSLLVDAIVGLIIVLAAYAIGNFILSQLGLTITVTG